MDKKGSEFEGFDYPDLDLSDQDSPSKQKNDDAPSGDPIKKTKIDQSIQKTNQLQAQKIKPDRQKSSPNLTFRPQAPFFPPPPPGAPNKGTPSWIPPPPIQQKTNYNQQSYQRPQYHNKNQYQQKHDNRQKKSTVYVKNIPKSYNTQEKLMTFFKNEGVIKQIKVNQLDQSAVIKFVKEENAAKFLKSNKIIFNRSYIVYGDSQNLAVTQQQIQDRINDELGTVKKAQKTNMKVLKQKVSNQLAQNIRAIYFFQNHLVEDSSQQTIFLKSWLQEQFSKKVQAKKMLETENTDDFRPDDYAADNYNWTLIFIRKVNTNIDRKSLFAEFLKYGPITSLDYECLTEKPIYTYTENKQQEDVAKPYLDYKIKLLFLGIKNAWQVYTARRNELDLRLEGKEIQRFFESGKLKTLQLKKVQQTEHTQQPQKIQTQPKTEQPVVDWSNQNNPSEKDRVRQALDEKGASQLKELQNAKKKAQMI